MSSVSSRRWLVGVAVSAALLSGPVQAAGLFDAIGEALFGKRQAEPQAVYEPERPLDLTVRAHRRRSVARSAPDERKVINTAIDPVQRPNWFLEDPTLRRGDVVVLDGRVLVFNGGHLPYTRADFAALDESRLLSKSLRDRVRAMAGLPPDLLPKLAGARSAEAGSRTRTALQE